jgi:hypothetical protein
MEATSTSRAGAHRGKGDVMDRIFFLDAAGGRVFLRAKAGGEPK